MKKLAFLLVWLWAAAALGAPYLGDYVEDETLYFTWHTSDSSGASITRSTDGTISVYKDGGVAQTTTGVTDTEDFDGVTGVHLVTIVLTDAFYVVGSDYSIVLSAATIDTQTVNATLAHFSIENRFDEVDVTAWTGTVVATPATAGYAYCTIKDGTGTGEVDTAAGAVVSVTTVATCTTASTCTALGADAVTAAAIAPGAITSSEAPNLDAAVSTCATPTEVNAEVVDVIRVDTNTIPGQVAPSDSPTLEYALMLLYKAWKNEKRQSETEYQLYDPTGVTVDQKATVSDAAGVTTVEEVVSGP